MKTTEPTNKSTSEICNALLRGELSAIETYIQAINKFAHNTCDFSLERIRGDHEASADSLREIIDNYEHGHATSSGPWGAFAAAAEGVAKLFGESSALIILQHGEVHGISEYEEALEEVDLNKSAKDLIRHKLLPALRNNLVELERYKSEAC